MPRHEDRAVEVVALLELPDPLTRVSPVVGGRDRPEGVRWLHHVAHGFPSAAGRPGDHAHQEGDGQEEDSQSREHVFVEYRTPVRLVKVLAQLAPMSPRALEGGKRHQKYGHREHENKCAGGTTPAVVVRGGHKPHAVCDEGHSDEEPGHRGETPAGQSVTSSGVSRVPLMLRTIIEWAGAVRRSVGEPGFSTQRCWNCSTCGTCVWP